MIIMCIVILVLFGIIVVQNFSYHRERSILYSLLEKNNGVPGLSNHMKSKEKKNDGMRGHKRALIKWRNGGKGGENN